jgi:hypothetical protein
MQFTEQDQTERQIEEIAERLEQVRLERDAAITAFDSLQAELIELLDHQGKKSINTEHYKVSKRYSERVITNESALKKALGAIAFNRLTDRKLNKTKLNAAVREGKVDPVIVAQCSEVKESAAWVTVSKVEGESE